MRSGPLPNLDDLLERYVALSAGAARACDGGDTTALAGALDARELVGAALADLGRTPRGPLPASTRRLIAEAAAANRALESRATSARDVIRRQLELVARDMAAVAGYAGAAPRRSRVDERR